MQKSYSIDGVSYNAETAKALGKERFLLNFTDKAQGAKVWGILEKNTAADEKAAKEKEAKDKLKEDNRKVAQNILQNGIVEPASAKV